MTSRGLRMVLALLSLPLVLEATNGCFTKPPRPEPLPLVDNALRCSCSCEDGGSRTVVVAASADDAEQSGLAMELDGPDLDIGERAVGLRFPGVAIPAGATILSAYVQFSADGSFGETTDVDIAAELSIAAPTFTLASDDVGSRTTGVSVRWVPDPWIGGDTGEDQRTPDLTTVLQELVELADWSDASPVVLIIDAGAGHRAARSFDGTASRAPVLVVSYDATVAASIPVCASEAASTNEFGQITEASLAAECALVEQTFEGLAAACGYPSSCDCDVVDVEVTGHDNSLHSTVCEADCDEVAVDATCTNFDPSGFADCLAAGMSVEDCKSYVAATNAAGHSPVCVNSGSPLAFHMYGERSLCELTGTSHIEVGDREPEQDPHTEGFVEILGGPCVGGGCVVHPYFDLLMGNITFEVKWASDPTFFDLSASGRGLQTAVVDGLEATFGPATIDGTGNGRRGLDGRTLPGVNDEDLRIGLDWSARACDMTGNIAADVDGEVPDGLCENDGTTVCTTDADCTEGVCLLEAEDTEQMLVDVTLTGTLVNQPPAADAGADQTVECTSAAGASFLLDGRGSSDPDRNLALASWRRGNRVGTVVGDDLVALQSLGLDESDTFVLRVIDGHAQSDEDTTTAEVVDSTAPVISCNLPATITPPKTPLAFTATAEDVCDTGVVPEATGLECYKLNKKGERVNVVCRATASGDSLIVLNSIGVGTHIDWHLGVADDSLNSSTATCHTLVVNPIKG